MTRERAIQAVSDALSMGITLHHKGLNGDAIEVSVSQAKYATSKAFIVYEYQMKHTFGEFQSRDRYEIAKWAVEQTGIKIGLVAERQCERFILNTTNRHS